MYVSYLLSLTLLMPWTYEFNLSMAGVFEYLAPLMARTHNKKNYYLGLCLHAYIGIKSREWERLKICVEAGNFKKVTTYTMQGLQGVSAPINPIYST